MTEDWVVEYLAGGTLDKVAETLNLSKQGAANKLRSAGIPVRSAVETRALQEQKIVAQHGDAIRDTFLRTRSIEQTAAIVQQTQPIVKKVVSSTVPNYEVLARAPRSRAKLYSDEDLIASLRDAAATSQTNLTTAFYVEYVKSFPELPDGRPRPGPQVMILRFQSWGAALTNAGLSANKHSGPAKQFEGVQTAVAAVVACWRDIGVPPSVGTYDEWQRGKEGRPSSASARRLVGGSWDTGLVQAWQVIHETQLPADDPDRLATSPSDVSPDGKIESPFESYGWADESVAVGGSLELTLPSYTALERALRSHARVQNAVASAVIARGFKPVSPGVFGPQFDVGFQLGERFVVVEVKSCSAHNIEFQVRLALGQVLHYAHQLRTSRGTVDPVLALESKPSQEWRDFLATLGVGLIVENSLQEDIDVFLGGTT